MAMWRRCAEGVLAGLWALALAVVPPAPGEEPRPEIELERAESSEDIAAFFKRKKVRVRSATPQAPTRRVRGLAIVGDGPPVEAEIDYEQLISFRIQFDTDSADIRHDSLGIVNEIAEALDDPALRGTRFWLNGHTDDVGKEGYNLELSRRRAESVRQALLERGVGEATPIGARGFGEGLPAASNGTPEGRATNRRVEVELRR